jgi:superkiller protein 3
MSPNKSTTAPAANSAAASSPAEQARLDAAMHRADQLLVSSLQIEERRRGRRRNRFIWGGLFMLTTVGVLLAAASFMAVSDREKAVPLAQEGWKLWQAQQYDQAASKFEEAVKLDPKNASAWNGLGWSRFNSGLREEATKAFQRVIKLEPKHPAALNGLGQTALMQRDYQNAEKHLLKAAPNAPAAWYGLARVYLLTGQFDKAKKWIDKIANSGDNDPALAEMKKAADEKTLPDSLRQQIEPPAAEEYAEGQSPGRAWQLMNQGRRDEAIEIYEAILAKRPTDAIALNGLGWCHLFAGDDEKAKPYFEKALAADPKASGSMNGLARCLNAQGDTAGAIKIWEQMVKEIPGPHAGTAGLADAYLDQNEFAKAIPLLEELLKASPADEQVKNKLARAKEQAGK